MSDTTTSEADDEQHTEPPHSETDTEDGLDSEGVDEPDSSTSEPEEETQSDSDPDDLQYREKNVEFRAADPERRVVFGAVLIPSALDHQGDFFRESTIHTLSDGFMESVADPDAEPAGEVEYPNQSGVGGVMHAIFPQDHLTIAENTILGEERRVGTGPAARTFEKGTWLQGWRVTDDDLWELIAEKDILTGFSIGMWVDGWEEYEPGDLPDDVRVPEAVQEDLREYDLTIDEVFTGEITGGDVFEASIVDSPAVPEALHVAHKSQDGGEWQTSTEPDALEASRESAGSHALAKAAGELTESHESCVEYLVNQRGHSEEDAEALASYLQRVVDGDGDNAGSPDQKSSGGFFGRAKSLVGLSSGPGGDEDEDGDGASPESGDVGGEGATLGGVTIESASDGQAEKAGRTLSERNQRRMMVIHDLTLSVLEDANAAGQRRPFVDDETNGLNVDVGSILDGALDERSGPAEDFDGSGVAAELDSVEPMGAAADSKADSPRDADPSDLPMNEEELEERFDSIESSVSDIADTVDKAIDSEEESDKDDDTDEMSQAELAEQTADLVMERLEDADVSDDEEDTLSTDKLTEMVGQLAENQKSLNENLSDVVELTSAIADADGVSQQTTDKSLSVSSEGSATSEESEAAAFFGVNN